MSKKEGLILKNFVKSKGVGITKFAIDMNYIDRQGLNYQLSKDVLDYEFKVKAAEVLGVDMNEIFGQSAKKNADIDTEKEALRDLVEAQKRIINYQQEFITAQVIRLEAFDSVILAKMVEKDFPAAKKDRPATLDAALKEVQADVQEKIEEIKGQLGLSV